VWESADFAAHGYTIAVGTERERIRVLVAEDNADLAAAVRELLQAEPDLEVVGVIADAAALARSVHELDADVVILDLNLAGGSSVPAMEQLHRARPRTGVVVYSGYDRAHLAGALPGLGASEYVAKSGEVTELIDAVRRCAQKIAAGTGR
jgi:DNA-binding NarL/FixJ family response regulator